MIGLLPETGLGPNGQLIAPPGLAKGLCHDVLHPGRDCGFFRNVEGIDIIPQEDWQQFIDAGTTLRHNSRFHFNQGSVGSCAAEGIYGGVEICRDVSGGPNYEPVEFNPYGAYYTTSGGRDNGSSLVANLREVRERGCVRASLHPRSKGWQAKPSGRPCSMRCVACWKTQPCPSAVITSSTTCWCCVTPGSRWAESPSIR